MERSPERKDWAKARHRLRGLAAHISVGVAAVIAAVVYDVAYHGVPTWSMLIIIGWGGILAVHVAYVMGLFDLLLRQRVTVQERTGEHPR
jgi:hypothetical protein